ncbi:MAG: hypothetical protein RIB77_29525 [Sandaracinaceae bacterium]
MNERLIFHSIMAALLIGGVATGCDDGTVDTGDASIVLDGDMDPDTGVDPVDAGDGGMMMMGCTTPPTPGRMGATCLGGTRCVTGLNCFEELTTLPMTGAQATLGNIFGIPMGTTPVPGQEGEFEAGGPSDVPIGFAPGGQCSNACDTTTDMCGDCATCSETLGGASAFGAVGIGAANLDISGRTSETSPGICRANCAYDPATNGGCPDGYTCDVSENVCIEACVSDLQCNLDWGLNRTEQLVTVQREGNPFTCNSTTGRCEWTPPADAAFGSECDSNEDCPSDIGVCLIGGRCATYQCNLPDATGMAPMFPCPDGAICVGVGGNDAAFCLDMCRTPDDCFAGQACSPQSGLPDDNTGLCFGICRNDGECHADERCRIGGFRDPEAGTCQPYCDPSGTDPMAITCESDEICVEPDGSATGFCRPLNQLCTEDADCNGNQACEVLGADFFGRCVDGCTTDLDCDVTMMEECRIQTGSTTGVCRVAGGECSPPSDRLRPSLPIRGDGQCLESQRCPTTLTENMIGNCEDRP